MKTPKPRGRPRAFDRTEKLEIIRNTFWKQGYEATSLDQIALATDLKRPSLYAAFGSKKDMYLESLEDFATFMEVTLVSGVTARMQPDDALKAVFSRAIEIYCAATDTAGPLGCMVAGTAPAPSAYDDQIRSTLGYIMQKLDTQLRTFLEVSLKDDGPTLSKEPQMASHILGTFLNGLSVRARSGQPARQLEETAHSLIDLLFQNKAQNI
ncbi:TetR/AcrR family transcriptional regulator [Flexibacterium corallicola]|uniref:TetR/AcrR family transcriptional regulator n=1 Tax=Flexibacterium corallicola TaxID=3037259 RepID=UPI00286F689D|nr:TetR/AcrR family transcriptional regulator [Pseudovibrio sp. M1P-2-3]